MCGRFQLQASGEELAEAFELEEVPGLAPRYNIAPGEAILTIPMAAAPRRARRVAWGAALAGPETAPAQLALFDGAPVRRDPARLVINARAESVARRPAFRDALAASRCVVPASGFYEWGPGRVPFHFGPAGGGLLPLAGLVLATEAGPACVILTTAADTVVAPVHHRMPVILAPDALAGWLDPRPASPMRWLEGAAAASPLTAWRVGPAVNSARHDAPDCLDPVVV